MLGCGGSSHPGSHAQERLTYHAVLVLLRGVVHSCVPRIGPTGVYPSRVQLPVPEGRGVLGTGSAPPMFPGVCSVQGPQLGTESAGESQVQVRVTPNAMQILGRT